MVLNLILLAAFFLALLVAALCVCCRVANYFCEKFVAELADIDRCSADFLWKARQNDLLHEIADLRQKLEQQSKQHQLYTPTPIVSDGLTHLAEAQMIEFREVKLQWLEQELENLADCEHNPELLKERQIDRIRAQLMAAIRWRDRCLIICSWVSPITLIPWGQKPN